MLDGQRVMHPVSASLLEVVHRLESGGDKPSSGDLFYLAARIQAVARQQQEKERGVR